jgi:hypothetical protein
MKTRVVAVALLMAFAPVAIGAPAFAQADDPTTKQARARFQEGVDYFDRQNYEAARASFLQAYALKKHPAVLLNLGLSCLKSNHPLEALTYLKQFLRDATNPSAQQRSEAEAGIRDAKAKLGQVEVTAPSGTEITIDNDRVGTTPLAEPVDVEPGPKAVRARLPDGSTDTQRISVSAGQKVQAKFGASAAPPLVAPVPVPVPTPGPATSSPEPTGPATPPPSAETAETGSKKNLFSRPATLVPVWIGVGFAAVGTGLAIGFYFAKQSAQDNANSLSTEITSKATAEGLAARGVCSSSDPRAKKYANACSVYKDDNDKVDQDAAVANVAVVVAVLGAATAIGWYLFAPKQADSKEKTSFVPVVTPEAAPGYGGLGVHGVF